MPVWLERVVIELVAKYLTPDVVAALETQAKQFVCCELAKVAKTTPTDLDDIVVAKVAAVLGVDLTKCPA